MALIVVIIIIILLTRWAYGGTTTRWQREYSKLCNDLYRKEINIEEFFKETERLNKNY